MLRRTSTRFAWPCLLMVLVSGCWYSTGTAPMTMNIFIDSKVTKTPVSAATVQTDLTTIVAIAAAEPSIGGISPAPAATPITSFAPLPAGLTFPPSGAGSLAYVGQQANDFVVYDNAPLASIPIDKLGAFGRPAAQMNTCMIAGTHPTSGIHSRMNKTVTLTPTAGTPPLPPPVTIKLKGSHLSHITAYTILHELIWHKVGGNSWPFAEGSLEPAAARLAPSGVHNGVNQWENIIPYGFVVPVGAAPLLFPPVRTPELIEWALQLGYIV